MNMRLLLIACAAGLFTVTASAMADPPIGSRLGERTKRNPVRDERQAALGAHEMARCLVDRRKRSVTEFLASVDTKATKRLSDRMSGEHDCFNMTPGNDMVEGRLVTFPHDIYRGMLAEWMIKADERSFAELPALPRQRIYTRNWYAVTDRDPSVDEMATCVSESAPGPTVTLMKTRPYSPEEGTAFGALMPHFGACLRAGVKLTGNRQSVRAALADALYQRLANPAPIAPQSAKQ